MTYHLGYRTGSNKIKWCSCSETESLRDFSKVLSTYTGKLILIVGAERRLLSFPDIREFQSFIPLLEDKADVKELTERLRKDIETTRDDKSGKPFEFLSSRILNTLRLLSKDQLKMLQLYVETKRRKGEDFTFYPSIMGALVAVLLSLLSNFLTGTKFEISSNIVALFLLAALIVLIISILKVLKEYIKSPYRTDQILLNYIDVVSKENATRDI